MAQARRKSQRGQRRRGQCVPEVPSCQSHTMAPARCKSLKHHRRKGQCVPEVPRRQALSISTISKPFCPVGPLGGSGPVAPHSYRSFGSVPTLFGTFLLTPRCWVEPAWVRKCTQGLILLVQLSPPSNGGLPLDCALSTSEHTTGRSEI